MDCTGFIFGIFFNQEKELSAWFEWANEYLGKYGYVIFGIVLAVADSLVVITITCKSSLR